MSLFLLLNTKEDKEQLVVDVDLHSVEKHGTWWLTSPVWLHESEEIMAELKFLGESP